MAICTKMLFFTGSTVIHFSVVFKHLRFFHLIVMPHHQNSRIRISKQGHDSRWSGSGHLGWKTECDGLSQVVNYPEPLFSDCNEFQPTVLRQGIRQSSHKLQIFAWVFLHHFPLQKQWQRNCKASSTSSVATNTRWGRGTFSQQARSPALELIEAPNPIRLKLLSHDVGGSNRASR